MADITLINLNMLFVRYSDSYEKELHLPLGPLYLTTALERAGYQVDFRNYQHSDAPDPFDIEAFAQFAKDQAPIIGLSCMANLLPFAVLAARTLKERYPDRPLFGGLGGGLAKGLFPTKNLNTVDRAVYFSSKTFSGLFGTSNAVLNLRSFGTSSGVAEAANFLP